MPGTVETLDGLAGQLRVRLEPELAGSRRARAWADADTTIEQQLHSELVLVCPDLRRRAQELMPERAPDAFLVRTARPAAAPAGQRPPGSPALRRTGTLLAYVGLRLGEVALCGLVTIGALVVLVSLLDVVVNR